VSDADEPCSLTVWDIVTSAADGAGTITTSILYYTDHGQESLVALNLKTGEKRIIKSNVPYIMQLKLYQKADLTGVTTPCMVNNGDCHHLCLPSKKSTSGRVCKCSSGLELQMNDGSCKPYQSFVLYATSSSIRALPLSMDGQVVGGTDSGVEALPVQGGHDFGRFDFDYRSRAVFFIEDRRLVNVMQLNFSWTSQPPQNGQNVNASSSSFVNKKVSRLCVLN
jgi:hypothetical protein